MTKPEYIQSKTANPYKVIYSYYKEKFDYKKHNPFLQENEFYHYIQMCYDINKILIKAYNYYDEIFNVTTILDQKGNIITFY